jgi:hypothetical protein
MADSPQLLSMAQQFSGLPLDSLIAGPLNASANANAAMALTQTKFILDNGFNKTTTGTGASAVTTYDPIMISMTLTRGVLTPGDATATPPVETSIKQFTTSFNLPVLTIIPINSLGVDNVDVEFEMNVKSSSSDDTSQSSSNSSSGNGGFEAKIGWGPVSVTVHGSVSYDHKDSQTHSTHYQASNSAKYTIKVHAGQLPIPKGVNTIIEAFANAIQPITMPAPAAPASPGARQ